MTPFIGELRMFAGTFAPQGWALCNGQSLGIAQNEALFQAIGTTYGGDGVTNFNVPNLSGRAPIHVGQGFAQGQMAGEETVTLTVNQMPMHNHTMNGSQNPATTAAPQGMVLASLPPGTNLAYGTDVPTHAIDPSSISVNGGNLPHDNLQPHVCISWIIALEGIFPTGLRKRRLPAAAAKKAGGGRGSTARTSSRRSSAQGGRRKPAAKPTRRRSNRG
jgi:microcystin-dependent protein